MKAWYSGVRSMSLSSLAFALLPPPRYGVSIASVPVPAIALCADRAVVVGHVAEW